MGKHKTTAELQTAFAVYKGADGNVDLEGFKSCIRELGIHQSDEELSELMRTADLDSSGTIDFSEFRKLFDAAHLRGVFEGIDEDNSGSITEEELHRALVSMHIHVTRSDVRKMVKRVDLNSDGYVSLEEFSEIFSGIPNATLESVARAWVHSAGSDVGSDLAPPIPPKDLPLGQFLVAGGFGGICSRTFTAPLERVKLQAQTGTLGNAGVFQSMRNIAAKEGIASGLFAGNFTNCLRVFPFAGMSCVFYSRFVKYLPCDSELDPMEPVWRAVAGGLAGVCATALTYPLDVIRAKQTVKATSETQSIRQVAKSIVEKGGSRALYKGMQSTLFAVAPVIGLQQASYDVLKQVFINGGYVEPSVGSFLGFGALAGLCAQCVVYPLDVVRRRIQLDKIPTNNQSPAGAGVRLYTWLALRSVAKADGFRGLYAGIVPTMMKVAPAVAVSVVCRDYVLGRLGD